VISAALLHAAQPVAEVRSWCMNSCPSERRGAELTERTNPSRIPPSSDGCQEALAPPGRSTQAERRIDGGRRIDGRQRILDPTLGHSPAWRRRSSARRGYSAEQASDRPFTPATLRSAGGYVENGVHAGDTAFRRTIPFSSSSALAGGARHKRPPRTPPKPPTPATRSAMIVPRGRPVPRCFGIPATSSGALSRRRLMPTLVVQGATLARQSFASCCEGPAVGGRTSTRSHSRSRPACSNSCARFSVPGCRHASPANQLARFCLPRVRVHAFVSRPVVGTQDDAAEAGP
jgi:hypothetical protein